MDITRIPEPVSTSNSSFLKLVDDHFANAEIIVLLVRYANSAGAKDYLVIRTKDEFYALLKKFRPKTSITVFFESAFPIKGLARDLPVKKVEELFAKEYDEYEGLDTICTEMESSDKGGKDILFIQQYLRQN